jgi:hypothetical protein
LNPFPTRGDIATLCLRHSRITEILGHSAQRLTGRNFRSMRMDGSTPNVRPATHDGLIRNLEAHRDVGGRQQRLRRSGSGLTAC